MARNSFIFLVLVLSVFSGCREYSVTGGPGPLVHKPLSTTVVDETALRKATTILLMPFDGGLSREVPVETLRQLDADFAQAIDIGTSFEVLNMSEKEKVSSIFKSRPAESGVLFDKALAVGKQLSSDVVMVSSMLEYGQAPSTEGNVRFSLKVYDVESRKEIWSASYKALSKPLSENLFRVKQVVEDGLVQKTSRAHAKEGFREVAKALESARTPVK